MASYQLPSNGERQSFVGFGACRIKALTHRFPSPAHRYINGFGRRTDTRRWASLSTGFLSSSRIRHPVCDLTEREASLLHQSFFLFFRRVWIVRMGIDPVFQRLGCRSWKPSCRSAFLRSSLAFMSIFDGACVTQAPHLLTSGEASEVTGIILRDDV